MTLKFNNSMYFRAKIKGLKIIQQVEQFDIVNRQQLHFCIILFPFFVRFSHSSHQSEPSPHVRLHSHFSCCSRLTVTWLHTQCVANG